MVQRSVGMIGAGWVTDHHLPAWASLGARARVVAICDPDIEAARRQARAHGIDAVFAGAEEMLSAIELDIVDICAPREAHPDLCRRAAGRGLAILCQKPLAPTLPEAERLAAEIGDRVPFMVHENWRFRAYYRALRTWLDAGAIGPLRHARLDFLSSGMIPDAQGARPALVRQPMLKGLTRLLVMEVLIHHLDTLRFLLGDLDLKAARLERSNDAIIGEDVAILALATAGDGVPVHVHGNFAVHGAPPAPKDQLRLFGRDGTITLDGTELRLDGPAPRAAGFDPDASYRDSYRAAIGHFLDGLDGVTGFETGPQDNLKTLRLVEEAYRLSGFETGAG